MYKNALTEASFGGFVPKRFPADPDETDPSGTVPARHI
jgi:hypothetical protein